MVSELLSVIVSAYNDEKYIERCLDSIINQTYGNIEIIVIDDGSTDDTLKKCNLIQSKTKNLKVFSKKNGGPSSARNFGLEKCTGKLITFVDSDDWVDIEIYKKCIDIFSNDERIDIVDFDVEFSNGKPVKKRGGNNKNTITIIEGNEQILIDYMKRGENIAAPFSSCRKIYKRDIIGKNRFLEGRQNEDIIFNFDVMKEAKLLVHINEIGYYYFQKDKSMSSGPFKEKDNDLIFSCNKILDDARCMRNEELIKLCDAKLGRSYFSLLTKMAVFGFANGEYADNITFIREYVSKLRGYIWQLMRSSMSMIRKILILSYCVNYRFSFEIIKLIVKERKR